MSVSQDPVVLSCANVACLSFCRLRKRLAVLLKPAVTLIHAERKPIKEVQMRLFLFEQAEKGSFSSVWDYCLNPVQMILNVLSC